MEKQIKELKEKIAHIKEYINSDFCKKCEEMYLNLNQCEKLLKELTEQDQ